MVGLILRSLLYSASGPDMDVIKSSHLAYQAAGLERSGSKAFGLSKVDENGNSEICTRWIQWGTEVRSDPGTAAAPAQKRAVHLVRWIMHPRW